jgi:hypothetical protein
VRIFLKRCNADPLQTGRRLLTNKLKRAEPVANARAEKQSRPSDYAKKIADSDGSAGSIRRLSVVKMFLTSSIVDPASGEAMEVKMNGFLIPAVMLVMVVGATMYIVRTGRNVNS